MLDLFTIVAPILGAGVMIFLFIQNQTLKARCSTVEDEAKYYIDKCTTVAESKDDFMALAEERYSEIQRLHKGIKMRDTNNWAMRKERDDAVAHLEKTLASSAAEHVSPDRIAVEVGRDHVYYTFSYDPPEYAAVHSLPQQKEGSTT